MQPDTTSQSPDLLRDVARLLEATRARLVSNGWRKSGISPPRGDGPACLYFTLRICAGLRGDETPSDEVVIARRLLVEELPEGLRRHGLTMWNDDRARTLEDVLTLVDAARSKITD